MDNLGHWSFYWVILVALVSFSAFIKPKRFSLIFALVCIWTGSVAIIIDWSALKLLIFLFIMFTILNGFPSRFYTLPYRISLLFFIIVFGGWSLFSSFLVPESGLVDLANSLAQTPPYRGIFSTIYFILVIVALPIAYWGVKTDKDISKIVSLVFITSAVAALVGSVEMISFRFFPVFNDIWLFINGAGNIEHLAGDGISITNYRPSPFVYEPRYYGIAMGFVISLSILCRIYPIVGLPKWSTTPFFILVCGIMLLSSSSISAIGGVITGLVAMGLWLSTHKWRTKRYVFKYTTLLTIVAAIFILTTDVFSDRYLMYLNMSGLMDTSWPIAGTADNIEARLSTTSFILWFIDQPIKILFGVGFGNGAYYAYDYISINTGFWKTGYMSSRVPLLDLISGIGIVGASCLYGIWYRYWIILGKRTKYIGHLKQLNSIEVIRGLIVYLTVSGLFFETYALTWFFLGAGLSLTSFVHKAGLNQDMFTSHSSPGYIVTEKS